MDRRSSFAAMLGKKQTTKKRSANNAPVLSSFAPYTGIWDFGTAKHLLGRTTYGPTYSEIRQAVDDGLAATIAKLFAAQPLPDPPVYYDFNNDPHVPLGETWVNTPPDRTVLNINGARARSLRAWMFSLMLEGKVSIREKMVLFWHNHFVTAQIARNQFAYNNINTIRTHALGNFKTLTEEMTIDPAMLVYLNGNENTRRGPNENYARELMELFLIGKGEFAGPGDHTTFTEQDVTELSRSLTGWVSLTADPSGVGSSFVRSRHDIGSKQLSHRFGNEVIENEDENEYKTVIDIIFQQDEVARFISRRLHIWFVGSNIDDFVEAEIIEPMAAMIRDNNYEIQPAVEALLSSEYFYYESIRGCMVNHPIDHLMKMVRPLHFTIPEDELIAFNVWLGLHRFASDQEMLIFDHPVVAGWKAFHQAPQFYDTWINSVSLPIREDLVERFISGFNVRGNRFETDLLAMIAEFENPGDAHALINDLAGMFFPYPIAENQLDFLTDFLIQGNPIYVWTLEYDEYILDPTNDGKRNAVLSKLTLMVEAMMKMPEFYLI